MLRAIHEIRPDWVVGENVGGILQVVQPGKETHVGYQPSLFGKAKPVYRKREEYVVETSAEILSVKDIPSSRCLFRLVPSVPRTEGTAYGLLPTPMARDYSPRGPNCLQKGLPEIIREMLLPTPTAAEIHHWQRVERWKRQGRTSMHEKEDGEKNPNGLTDFLDFHGLLPTPTARDWKGAPTLEHFARKGKKPHQGSLPDFFARTGRSFQLNPLFVAEMMGFPTDWTVSPFLPGGSSPSRDTETPSSPR
jgi:hypothetical protein